MLSVLTINSTRYLQFPEIKLSQFCSRRKLDSYYITVEFSTTYLHLWSTKDTMYSSVSKLMTAYLKLRCLSCGLCVKAASRCHGEGSRYTNESAFAEKVL